jgi:hypothetical protein
MYWYVRASFNILRGIALKFSSHSKDILNRFRKSIPNLPSRPDIKAHIIKLHNIMTPSLPLTLDIQEVPK